MLLNPVFILESNECLHQPCDDYNAKCKKSPSGTGAVLHVCFEAGKYCRIRRIKAAWEFRCFSQSLHDCITAFADPEPSCDQKDAIVACSVIYLCSIQPRTILVTPC